MGAGIVRSILAEKHPTAEVAAFDRCENPLVVGETLAKSRARSNIFFRRASYVDLCDASFANKYDLVLFYYGLDLGPPDPLMQEAAVSTAAEQIQDTYLQPARAISNLLTPEGIGVICSSWPKRGTAGIFEAFRKVNLAIDWDISFSRGTIKDNNYLMSLGYVFVRKDIIPMTKDTEEDLLAFWASGELAGAKLNFSTGAEPIPL